jgi:hypothetical protein
MPRPGARAIEWGHDRRHEPHPHRRGHEIDFEDRFKRRVHLVDRHPGFVRNEVHRPKPMRFDHERGGWIEGSRTRSSTTR